MPTQPPLEEVIFDMLADIFLLFVFFSAIRALCFCIGLLLRRLAPRRATPAAAPIPVFTLQDKLNMFLVQVLYTFRDVPPVALALIRDTQDDFVRLAGKTPERIAETRNPVG